MSTRQTETDKMSTRQKRGGQKNSKPVPKVARVEPPAPEMEIQGPEVNGAQVNSPNSPSNLDPDSDSDSDSDSEDEEEEDELPGLSDDNPENDPLRHLMVVQRNNLNAGKQGRQFSVNACTHLIIG